MLQQAIEITKAAEGLYYLSESDYPFEWIEVHADEQALIPSLKKLSEHPLDKVETRTLDAFFKNSVTSYPTDSEVQKNLVQRFMQLKEILQKNLQDPMVYRIGNIQVDAFIVGKLSDGTYGGLRTKLIET